MIDTVDTTQKAPSFRWWPKEAVAQLREQLNAHPDAILKQFDDAPNYLHVHPMTDSHLAADCECPSPINDSRLCPPICP